MAETLIALDSICEVVSGTFHSTSELDPGDTPLISCGDFNNGLVGFFDIPPDKTFSRCITVAYNGSPLTAKFHPYTFGGKDDVAILIPRWNPRDTTLFYIAALLNSQRWRYSYGRKCFREKLRCVTLSLPTASVSGSVPIDEGAIARLWPGTLQGLIPKASPVLAENLPHISWRSFSLVDLFTIRRGDFHSLQDLEPGESLTVSRIADDNGVVGRFAAPDGAHVYPPGTITISSVEGKAFVQLQAFVATDNVIICVPKEPLRLSSSFFVALMIDQQKWRYSYGRQCYMNKVGRVRIYLPVTAAGSLDEDVMRRILEETSFWPVVERHLKANAGDPQRVVPPSPPPP